MSFDENTKTMNVEAREWLEASEIVEVRGYLLPVETVEPMQSSIQFTATGFEIPVPTGREHQSTSLTARLNEAYRDDVLEPEEREFLELTREHFSRLDE